MGLRGGYNDDEQVLSRSYAFMLASSVKPKDYTTLL